LPKYNDIGVVHDINHIDSKAVKSLSRFQRRLNSVGMTVEFFCGRIIKDKHCGGRITKKKKSGLIYCKSCKARWENGEKETKSRRAKVN